MEICVRIKSSCAPARLRAGALALVVLFTAVSCGEPKMPVPDEIRGHWRSDHVRYRDRTFEIRENAVLFGTGEFSAAALHRIVTVEPVQRRGATDEQGWRLVYSDHDGGTDAMELVYRAEPAPGLRFANREDWWRRPRPGDSDE